MGDIAALIAPRPLLVETGTKDPLNGWSGLANAQARCFLRRAQMEWRESNSLAETPSCMKKQAANKRIDRYISNCRFESQIISIIERIRITHFPMTCYWAGRLGAGLYGHIRNDNPNDTDFS